MTVVVRLVTLAVVLVAVSTALHHLAAVTESDMSASRIVPAVALARGFPIYAGPDAGPIIDFMYGPVAALAFLPAALATTPSGALAIGALTNVVFFFGPVLWLHRRALGRRDLASAGFVLFVLGVLHDPGLVFSALTIHADAPALGLGALACGLLVTGPARGRVALPALAVVLSAAAKQTMAPLALAMLGYVAARDGGRAAARFAGWLAGFGAAVAAVSLAVFGPAEIVFNMVTLPSRMPWYGEATSGGWGNVIGFTSGRWGTVAFTAGLLGWLTWLPASIVVLLVLARLRRRDPIVDEPSTLLVAAAVVLAPVAIVGAAKVGGYFNTFSVSTYFLLAAATIGLARAGADHRAGSVARLALVLGLALVAAALARGPVGLRSVAPTIARLRAWDDNPHQRAYRVARAHPGEVGFPWNPLAVLLAENRLDSNEIGAWNRDLAKVPIDDALWRRHLPPHLRFVAFRPATGAFTWLPEPTARLPELTAPATLPGLEGWTVLGPAVAAPSPSRQEVVPHVAPAPPHP